jgi:hypothetical protein
VINIGTDSVEAIKELRGNRDFAKLLDALETVINAKVYEAGRAPVEQRIDQTAYAAGMFDLWRSLHATHAGLHPSQVKPQPKKAPAYA